MLPEEEQLRRKGERTVQLKEKKVNHRYKESALDSTGALSFSMWFEGLY